MILAISRNVEENVFDTRIKCAAYGTQGMTEEQEKEMLMDYVTELEYKNIEFVGKYSVKNGNVAADADAGEEVSLNLNNLKIRINEDFDVHYSVNSNKISDKAIGTILNTKELVAQAQCILFEDKIQAEVLKLLEATRAKVNTFEGNSEVTL